MSFHSLEADRFWARQCLGFHIQARPLSVTAKNLVALQRRLLAASPVTLLPIPANALHISVFTLVSAHSQERSKEELWTTIRKAMSKEMVALAYAKEPIPVTFRRLAFTPKAVIVATEDQPEPFRTLRVHLGALLRSLDLHAPRVRSNSRHDSPFRTVDGCGSRAIELNRTIICDPGRCLQKHRDCARAAIPLTSDRRTPMTANGWKADVPGIPTKIARRKPTRADQAARRQSQVSTRRR